MDTSTNLPHSSTLMPRKTDNTILIKVLEVFFNLMKFHMDEYFRLVTVNT